MFVVMNDAPRSWFDTFMFVVHSVAGILLAALIFYFILKYNDPDIDYYNSMGIRRNMTKKPGVGTKHRIKINTINNSEKPRVRSNVNIPSSVKYCWSDKCMRIAKSIDKSMSPNTAKPCEDFYHHVCGGFGQNDVPVLALANELNTIAVAEQINQLINQQSLPKYQKKVLDYFQRCFDDSWIYKHSRKELMDTIKSIGPWPLLQTTKQWDSSSFNWVETLNKVRKLGFNFNYFFDLSFGHDLHLVTKKIITLDVPSFSINRAYLMQDPNNSIIEDYTMFVKDVNKIFGVEDADQDLKDIVNFEMELANLSLLNTEEEQSQMYKYYEHLSIKELQSKYPILDWLEYINDLFHPHDKVTNSEMVHVVDPKYFKAFTEFMVERKPSNRLLANYIYWRMLRESLFYMDETILEMQNQFHELVGEPTFIERGKECVLHLSSRMYLALSALFVKNHFDKHAVGPVKDMAENIRHSFEETIKKVKWMDEKTKEAALKKVTAMALKVGYPNQLDNTTKLNNYYKDFRVDGKSYLKTALKYNLFILQKEIREFREPFDKSDWRDLFGNAIQTNAFYDPRNAVYLPAATIHELLYHVDYPNFVNYARLGQTLGHEMVHALDKNNRLFDGQGNKTNWWSAASEQKYLQKTDCIADQYGSFPIDVVVFPEEHVIEGVDGPEVMTFNADGYGTLNENIAEIGGTKIAYHAYTSWLKDKRALEDALPEFGEYTPEQMFWISYASMMCEPHWTFDSLMHVLHTEEHPPNKIRVLGSLINLPEFSRDFGCSPQDPINIARKCDMWR